MSVCNIYKRFEDTSNPNFINNGQGIFLTFSQYTEDLTEQNSDPNNYRVVPSKFLCLNLQDFSQLPQVSGTKDPNTDLPYMFQSYYENCMAHLRTTYPNITKQSSTAVLFKSMEKYGLLTRNSDTNGTYYNEIVCGDEINVVSNRTITGTNYDEIYCLVEPSKPKTFFYINPYGPIENTITVSEQYELDNILGWKDSSESYSYPNYPSGNTGLIRTPLFDSGDTYDDSGVLVKYLNNPGNNDCSEQTDNSFNFNCILVFYDVYKSNNSIPTITRGLPLGIWFSGPYDTNALLNPVTKFVRSDSIFGQGTSYGLRICLKNVSSPFGVDIAVQLSDSQEPIASLSELCDVFSQSVVAMNNVAAAANADMVMLKDSLSQFVNGRTNVPYLKEINGINYWFVNGRKVGVAEDLERTIDVNTIGSGTILIEEVK